MSYMYMCVGAEVRGSSVLGAGSVCGGAWREAASVRTPPTSWACGRDKRPLQVRGAMYIHTFSYVCLRVCVNTRVCV